jgi:nuclear cap-binding protein subunit 2
LARLGTWLFLVPGLLTWRKSKRQPSEQVARLRRAAHRWHTRARARCRVFAMSRLLKSLEPLSQYKDRKFDGNLDEYVACLRRSTTVYVGNLAFHTTEEQIHELFGKCGPLHRIVMGLDKNAKTPCGFCFVEYGCRRDTEECVKYLNGARLDERDVRIDFDWCAQAAVDASLTASSRARWLAARVARTRSH